MTEIFSAKSLDEAKAMAADFFGVDESEIKFTILAEPKKSIFGMLRSEAKVEAEYTPDESADNSENSDNSDNSEPLSKAEIAQNYVKSILDKMGIDSGSTIEETESGAIITFNGDNSGAVIGRRGETLDALQYLASMVCNKGDRSEYYRITLGYRAKRKQTLEELAVKISKSVIKSGRSTALEPMNPYERRIIHSAVSEIEGVSSHSVGEEPYRKVVISSTTKRNDRPKKDYKKKNKNFTPRSLDLKTSFEKDYKKPKPEDNINAGLYGKIEF